MIMVIPRPWTRTCQERSLKVAILRSDAEDPTNTWRSAQSNLPLQSVVVTNQACEAKCSQSFTNMVDAILLRHAYESRIDPKSPSDLNQ